MASRGPLAARRAGAGSRVDSGAVSELPVAAGCGKGSGLRPRGASAGGSSGCPRPLPSVPGADLRGRVPAGPRRGRLEVGSSSSERGSREARVWVEAGERSCWDCKMEVMGVWFAFISLVWSVFHGDTLLGTCGYKTEMSSFGFYSFTATPCILFPCSLVCIER